MGCGVTGDRAHLGGLVAGRPEAGDPAEVKSLLEAEEIDIELVSSGGAHPLTNRKATIRTALERIAERCRTARIRPVDGSP